MQWTIVKKSGHGLVFKEENGYHSPLSLSVHYHSCCQSDDGWEELQITVSTNRKKKISLVSKEANVIRIFSKCDKAK